MAVRRCLPRLTNALDTSEVRGHLADIDYSELVGQRDHCLLTVALMTGRRCAELAALRAGDVERCGTVTWRRVKGGGRLGDQLRPCVADELLCYFTTLYGDAWAVDAPV